LILLAVASCTNSTDIVGPFTGPVTRFAVDSITLPTSGTVWQIGDDLDGNGYVDNELGQLFGSLSSNRDLSTHAADMIASGAIASSLELQAPDLTTAAKAGATYYGADNADATLAGGKIVGGVFTSNRTRTTHVPGRAVMYLPVFADADPSIVEIDYMELDLTPDGNGGYDALVRGGARADDIFAAMCDAIPQMIIADPTDHYELAGLIDTNHDGQLSCAEIRRNPLFVQWLYPDVVLEGETMISVGFAVHLVPCDAGPCAVHQPTDPCHDRVMDNGETGIDCGGSCAPCPVLQPSCSDGVRDGLETDIDCGWNCGKCALGQYCWNGGDCASGFCNGGQPGLGRCLP
jgi:hypothetical protein